MIKAIVSQYFNEGTLPVIIVSPFHQMADLASKLQTITTKSSLFIELPESNFSMLLKKNHVYD